MTIAQSQAARARWCRDRGQPEETRQKIAKSVRRAWAERRIIRPDRWEPPAGYGGLYADLVPKAGAAEAKRMVLEQQAVDQRRREAR